MSNLVGASEEELVEERLMKPEIPEETALARETVLWRLARIGIAVPLIVVSGFALFPYSGLPVSSQGVVNARLSTVKSPMDGQLGEVKLETGDSVSVRELLTTVGEPASLRTGLSSSEPGKDALEDEASRTGAALAAAQIEKSRYDAMYTEYSNHLVEDLTSRLADANRAEAEARKKVATVTDEVKRGQDGFQQHLVTKQVLDLANERLETAQQSLETQTALVTRLKKQLSDARAGYLPESGANTPSFVAQRDLANSDIDKLGEQMSAINLRMSKMSKDPSRKAALPREVAVISPVPGAIWARSVATGQEVVEGDDLFRVADEGSIHVEVWVDRRYGPQISIGDMALVYLSGLNIELRGRVAAFEGTNRRRGDEEVNAIDLAPVHPDQYHVTIELDPSDRKGMYIGQSAKVLFPGTKHQIRSKIYFWLTRI